MNPKQRTVLVAADDPSHADLYAAWLRERYAVRVAHTTQAALAALDPDVDAVVLDRALPGRAVLVDELRRRGGGCRVVMVTGVRPTADVLDAGFDAHVVKPVARDDLRGAVTRLRQRDAYDEQLDRLYGLAHRAADRDPSDAEHEVAAVRERADDAVASFDRDDFRVAFRDLDLMAGECS
jgi:DNA-binding response OmpR family regulator